MSLPHPPPSPPRLSLGSYLRLTVLSLRPFFKHIYVAVKVRRYTSRDDVTSHGDPSPLSPPPCPVLWSPSLLS